MTIRPPAHLSGPQRRSAQICRGGRTGGSGGGPRWAGSRSRMFRGTADPGGQRLRQGQEVSALSDPHGRRWPPRVRHRRRRGSPAQDHTMIAWDLRADLDARVAGGHCGEAGAYPFLPITLASKGRSGSNDVPRRDGDAVQHGAQLALAGDHADLDVAVGHLFNLRVLTGQTSRLVVDEAGDGADGLGEQLV